MEKICFAGHVNPESAQACVKCGKSDFFPVEAVNKIESTVEENKRAGAQWHRGSRTTGSLSQASIDVLSSQKLASFFMWTAMVNVSVGLVAGCVAWFNETHVSNGMRTIFLRGHDERGVTMFLLVLGGFLLASALLAFFGYVLRLLGHVVTTLTNPTSKDSQQ